ncbi:MAG: hypothetical protein ABJA49_14460 [Betaproteobacteria bacterium]
MKLKSQPKKLLRHVLAVSMTAALSLTAAAPLHAATSEHAKAPVAKATGTNAPATKPAQRCPTELGAFQGQMQKDGYWRGVTGYGYGYPMQGYGYDETMPLPATAGASAPVANTPGGAAYWSARPGYEVRTLLAATQILAQDGQQVDAYWSAHLAK